jgi:hypothetical protein
MRGFAMSLTLLFRLGHSIARPLRRFILFHDNGNKLPPASTFLHQPAMAHVRKEDLEAGTGIEPVFTDLQSAA